MNEVAEYLESARVAWAAAKGRENDERRVRTTILWTVRRISGQRPVKLFDQLDPQSPASALLSELFYRW